MEKIVNTILTSSDPHSLKSFLDRHEESLENQSTSAIDWGLEAMTNSPRPGQLTLGWLYLLHRRLSTDLSFTLSHLVSHISKFFNESIPEQLRMDPLKVAFVAEKYTSILAINHIPMKGIRPLRNLLIKFRPTPEHLTPIHSYLLQLCLLAKTYHIASEVLEQEVYEIHTPSTALLPPHMMTFYYYGGMVYIGLKNYEQALEFFKMAISVPSSVSSIMVESYKKFILVSLIVHGQVISLPRYTPHGTQRMIKRYTVLYQELATAFSTHSTVEVIKIAEKSKIFEKDHNSGLVKQVIRSLDRKNIQRCTQTYLTLSLENISETVKLNSAKEAELAVLRMIEDGAIYATINQKDGMISFHEETEQYNTNRMLSHVDQQIQSVFKLGTRMKNVEEAIALSQNYIIKTSIQERQARWGDLDDFEVGDKTSGMLPIRS